MSSYAIAHGRFSGPFRKSKGVPKDFHFFAENRSSLMAFDGQSKKVCQGPYRMGPGPKRMLHILVLHAGLRPFHLGAAHLNIEVIRALILVTMGLLGGDLVREILHNIGGILL